MRTFREEFRGCVEARVEQVESIVARDWETVETRREAVDKFLADEAGYLKADVVAGYPDLERRLQDALEALV